MLELYIPENLLCSYTVLIPGPKPSQQVLQIWMLTLHALRIPTIAAI